MQGVKKGPATRGSVAGKKKAAPFNPKEEIRQMEDIHEVLAAAQQMRKYFQVERDKVHDMWEISKKELDNERHHLTNLETDLEEMERAHQIEMKVYKQKVRHLLYDQKVTIKQLRGDSDAQLQQAEAAHEKRMASIEADRQNRFKGVESAMEQHEVSIADKRDSHRYMVSVTKRQNHERELARLKATYEAKVATLREDLELRRRAEITDAEERKNEHINHLIRQHEEKFAEMKSYYNTTTKNNLEIIQCLKDEIATMKSNDTHNETLMYDIEKENHHLIAPLEQAERDVADLQAKKKLHLQEKQSLRMTEARLRTLRADLKALREEHMKLEDKFKDVYDQREELKGKFERSLRDAMDVVNERNATLQQSLLEAHARVEERDAQLDGVLRAMNIEPNAVETVSHVIDDLLATKNQLIKDMHFELRKMEHKVDAVVVEYERRCRAVGLPVLARENFVSQ